MLALFKLKGLIKKTNKRIKVKDKGRIGRVRLFIKRSQ